MQINPAGAQLSGQARIIQGGVLLSELFLDVSPGNPAGNPSIVELMPDFDERVSLAQCQLSTSLS